MLNIITLENWFELVKSVWILTKDSFRYDFFVANFKEWIKFIKDAKVTLEYSNKEDLEIVFDIYSNFCNEYFEWFEIIKWDQFVSVPLVVLFLYDIKTQILKQLNLATSKYMWLTSKTIIDESYYHRINRIWDFYFLLLINNQRETFSFEDQKVFKLLQSILSENENLFTEIINDIRNHFYRDKNIDNELLQTAKIDLFDDSIKYSVNHQKNFFRAYILFHIIFLKKRLSLFISNDTIKWINWLWSDINIVDRQTLDIINDEWLSWILINLSLRFDFIISEVENWKELSKYADKVQELFINSIKNKDASNRKALDWLENQISRFPRADFRIIQTNGIINKIERSLVVSDPKQFFSVWNTLKTKKFEVIDYEWKQRKYTSKTNVSEM